MLYFEQTFRAQDTTVNEKSCNCRKGHRKSLTFIPYRKKLIRLSVFWKSRFLDFSWASIISDRIKFILFILDNITFYQISNIFALDGFSEIIWFTAWVITCSRSPSRSDLIKRTSVQARMMLVKNSLPSSIKPLLEVGDRFDRWSPTSLRP